MNNSPVFLITIDVEDWFQVENFKPLIAYSEWWKFPLRVEKNTHLILDALERNDHSHMINNKKESKIQATFFILGWIAERLPGLIQEIKERGHEVASHGYTHCLNFSLTQKELLQDLTRSKKILEDITGEAVIGYRAPAFSLSSSILDNIQSSGYVYDSSFNSSSLLHKKAEIPLEQDIKKCACTRIKQNFFEIPISNFNLGRFSLPWGGGGYFRLLPYPVFKSGVRSMLKKYPAYVFYLHPWEIDPGQPRMQNASMSSKFRHYLNIESTFSKLHKLLQDFQDCRFLSCSAYLKENYPI